MERVSEGQNSGDAVRFHNPDNESTGMTVDGGVTTQGWDSEAQAVQRGETISYNSSNKVSAMIRIILPLAAPGIVTAAMFVFIAGWNEYTLSLILIGDSSLRTINLGISTQRLK